MRGYLDRTIFDRKLPCPARARVSFPSDNWPVTASTRRDDASGPSRDNEDGPVRVVDILLDELDLADLGGGGGRSRGNRPVITSTGAEATIASAPVPHQYYQRERCRLLGRHRGVTQ